MFRRVQSEKSGKYIGIVLLYHQEKENPSSVERPTTWNTLKYTGPTPEYLSAQSKKILFETALAPLNFLRKRSLRFGAT